MPQDAASDFAAAFAHWVGVSWGFPFWKGRVAIYAVLRALGVGEGDEVLVPGYTCVVAVNPIKYLRATPVYVDIDPHTYNIDPSRIESKITPRTKLIVAQHTYGYPAEMDEILAIANRHGLPVMEDSCLAVGSTYKGRRTGTFGLAAVWSGQWNKTFTTGIGGLATTNDRELAGKIGALCERELRPAPRKASLVLALQRQVHRALVFPRTTALIQSVFRWMVSKKLLVGSSSTAECRLEYEPGFFMGMGAGQGRVGLRELRRLDANVAHRRRMTGVYDRLLAERRWPARWVPSCVDPVLVRYPVRVAGKEALVVAAHGHGVELGTWFESPVHQATISLDRYDYYPGMCPQAEKAAREAVNLPTHRRANDRVAHRTVEFLCRQGKPAS